MFLDIVLYINIMIIFVLAVVYFTSFSSTVSNNKLRQSFMQTGQSGWETCTSCKIYNPSNIKDIKLEIQDVKDNVDFHFSHFEEELKNHLSNIREGIDTSFSNKFQKASDSVIEKLENIRATISVNYKELSESLGTNDKISDINSKLVLVKSEVPKFVSNGLESFVVIFKKLKEEFTITPSGKKDQPESKNQETGQELTDNNNLPNSAAPTPNKSMDNTSTNSSMNTTYTSTDPTNINNGTDNSETNSSGTGTNNTNGKADITNTPKVDKIDLESIPNDAIIRTINSYLEDVDVEGKKLLNVVLFKVK